MYSTIDGSEVFRRGIQTYHRAYKTFIEFEKGDLAFYEIIFLFDSVAT